MQRAFNMYSDDTDCQTFKYLNVFACIENCKKWADIRRNLAKNMESSTTPTLQPLPRQRATPSSARRS
jgi:hypothetical protein